MSLFDSRGGPAPRSAKSNLPADIGLARPASAPAMAATAKHPGSQVTEIELARELQELIAALDRRVPRVEQAGEISIARDAAALRAKAVERLATLTYPNAPAAVGDSDSATRSSDGQPG